MRVKEIVASRTIKVSLGNYESVDIFVSMKAELDDMDDEFTCHEQLGRRVESAAFVQLVNAHQARGKTFVKAELTKRYGVRE